MITYFKKMMARHWGSSDKGLIKEQFIRAVYFIRKVCEFSLNPRHQRW